MNMQVLTDRLGPTLDQRLRYIDITFECLKRAQKIVERIDGPAPPAFGGYTMEASPRGKRIGGICARLRLKQCEREGVPMPADHWNTAQQHLPERSPWGMGGAA